MADTAQPEALVETALAQLCSWPGLLRSPQLARFLNYIVSAKLRGDDAAIKAYAIAVDVFGRPQSFDPQTDPIVRVQARRLRAALDEYYAGEGAASPVRIYLPVGRYVPEFQFRDPAAVPAAPPIAESIPDAARPPPAPPPQFRRPIRLPAAQWNDWLLYALVLVIGLGVAVVLLQVLSPRPTRIDVPQPPTIGISEFTAIAAADGSPAGSVAGLAIELVTDLQLFDDIRPSYMQGEPPEDAAGPAFLLTGIARQEAGTMQVTASLRRRGSDTALWSFTQAIPVSELGHSIDDISRVFSEQLGAHRGPLFADANRWLNDNPNIVGHETSFLCGLLFSRYRDSSDLADAARARDCVASMLLQGNDPLALAMRGALLIDDAAATQPVRIDPEPMAEATRLLTEAVRLDATSSFIWREYARLLYRSGRLGESENAYASALQLNPANLDAVAGYGAMLSVRGASPLGKQLADRALTHAFQPPHWYYAAPAINALRDGQDALAIDYAGKLSSGDAELASVIATVAALRIGSEDVLNRYFAQMLDVTRFRRFGILPVLQRRIPDTALVDEIALQLTRAGVATGALNGSF